MAFTPEYLEQRKRRINVRVQSGNIQRFAYDLTLALQKELTDEDGNLCITRDKDGKLSDANAVAQVIKAWEIASERCRIAKGKPLPGTLRPVAKPKHTKSKTEPEPVTPQEAKAEIVPVIEPVPTPAT
jgi:hypothetical protein